MSHGQIKVNYRNGSYYRARELIPCIFEIFKNKLEGWKGGGGTELQQQTYQFTQGYNILDYKYTT